MDAGDLAAVFFTSIIVVASDFFRVALRFFRGQLRLHPDVDLLVVLVLEYFFKSIDEKVERAALIGIGAGGDVVLHPGLALGRKMDVHE